MRFVVYHSGYGCDTGCCGHVFEVTDDDGKTSHNFQFDHPWNNDPEEVRNFVRQWVIDDYGEEHCKDIDWENCNVFDD